jgi:hypothetical protein
MKDISVHGHISLDSNPNHVSVLYPHFLAEKEVAGHGNRDENEKDPAVRRIYSGGGLLRNIQYL